MRLNEIKGTLQSFDNINPEEAAKRIARDCKPWISLTNRIVYRGINTHSLGLSREKSKNQSPSFIKKQVRQNREPKDTFDWIDTRMHKMMMEKFGFSRKNSIFVTGNPADANSYGVIYGIWPIGSFKFLWSTKFMDMTPEIHTEYRDLASFNTKAGISISNTKEKLLNDAIKTFNNKDLEQAIKSNHEIIVHCESYYGVKYDYRHKDSFQTGNESITYRDFLKLIKENK